MYRVGVMASTSFAGGMGACSLSLYDVCLCTS